MSDSTPSTTTLNNALDEAALRLAWYLRTYGEIPSDEVVKLTLIATGIQRRFNTNDLLTEAREVRAHLLELCTDRNVNRPADRDPV
jgi:hypothetical protein